MRILLALLLTTISLTAAAQTKIALVNGRVIDENENPLQNVSVTVLGKATGTVTNDSGYFKIKVPAGKAFALIFSFTGYKDVQKNFYLSNNEEETAIIPMERGGKTMDAILVTDDNQRNETGLVKINPKNAITLPSTIGGVEGLIKILVGSNNELTSAYSVRGGNYDENLIYVNLFVNYNRIIDVDTCSNKIATIMCISDTHNRFFKKNDDHRSKAI